MYSLSDSVESKSDIEVVRYSGKFGHQVNSDTHLQIVLIQMRRLLMSRLIRIFTVCLGNLFLYQYLKYETNKVAVRI